VSHSESHPQGLAHQFDDLGQQHEASSLGMWGFLVTEIMFFGGLFLGYTLVRWQYPEAVIEASHFLDWRLGGLNTGLLLISSLTMALAVHSAQEGKSKLTTYFLIITMVLGAGFLGVKAFEYVHKWHDHLFPGFNFIYEGEGRTLAYAKGAEMYLYLYFAMTGVHALHMIIGLGVVAVVARKAWRGDFTKQYNNPVEITGLYWHFVDIIWIFLYPLLYLVHPR